MLQALKCSVLGDYFWTTESTVKLNIGDAWQNRNRCAVRDSMCLLIPLINLMFKPFSTSLFCGAWDIWTEPHHSCFSHLHILNCMQKFLMLYFIFLFVFKVLCAGAMIPRNGVRFKILIMALLKNWIFWDVSLHQETSYQHFEWTRVKCAEKTLGLLDPECDYTTGHSVT